MVWSGIDRGPGPGMVTRDVIFMSLAPVKSTHKTRDDRRGFPRRKPGVSAIRAIAET